MLDTVMTVFVRLPPLYLLDYLPQVANKLYYIMLYWVHHVWAEFELTTLVVICTDCIGNCKSNYHMITTTKASINISDNS
jgi:hypothetical protein